MKDWYVRICVLVCTGSLIPGKQIAHNITFERATREHQQAIFSWLEESHVREFWDNTRGHKDDITNFMDRRFEPSSYAQGRYVYFVAKEDTQPYALIMVIENPAMKTSGTPSD